MSNENSDPQSQDSELDFEEQQQNLMQKLLTESIEKVTQNYNVKDDEVHQAMGDILMEHIQNMEPYQITELFSELEYQLFDLQLNQLISERQLTDEELQSLGNTHSDLRRDEEEIRRRERVAGRAIDNKERKLVLKAVTLRELESLLRKRDKKEFQNG